jgi:hypothetical protein
METGSRFEYYHRGNRCGKSLVIDAIELLLNGIASENVIRHGESEAHVEGVFILSADNKPALGPFPDRGFNHIKSLLTEKGLNSDEETLVINYNVRKQRADVARINGRAVTKTVLRQIGQLLVDIHGQSEHLSLLDKRTISTTWMLTPESSISAADSPLKKDNSMTSKGKLGSWNKKKKTMPVRKNS